ncbi:hypothetical protein M2A_1481 [Tepidicaulis marinus]|uniref:Uncharacterized protein n=1 Tax=Tepidicaulis marinus TaxID=1333998 RepID=A0A081BAB4_9HYPH|nr:hypothetical protein M2A_1481 [Tepidicaulis marinus]
MIGKFITRHCDCAASFGKKLTTHGTNDDCIPDFPRSAFHVRHYRTNGKRELSACAAEGAIGVFKLQGDTFCAFRYLKTEFTDILTYHR